MRFFKKKIYMIAKGSLILLSNGTFKKIEDIKEEDIVWAMKENFKISSAKVIKVKKQEEKECLQILNNLEITKDQPIYCSARNHKPSGYFSLENLKEKDKVLLFNLKYAAKNSLEFKRGYLRGFVDGDGHIGNRSIFTCQKEKDILVEFWNIYKEVIEDTSTKIIYDEKRNIYIGEGGYSKKFKELTKINFNEEYAKGYLNGMLIADGCAAYNKANNFFRFVLTQSFSANKIKCENIEKMLDILDISFSKWNSTNKGFLKEKGNVNYYNIPKPWKIPLIYGSSKKDKMIKKINTYGSLKFMPKETIKKIISIGKRKMYYIDTETHTFFANGILVHS